MVAQTKYRSHSAFQYGVANVNEALTDGERLVLYSLAVAADYKQATSHPGNAAMMRQSNRSERGVRDIIKRLIVRRLIERITVGDGGRGLATMYRICVEDHRFPEPRKPGSNRCRVIEMKPGSNDCPVSDGKPGSGEQETRQLDGENPAVWTAAHPIKPSSTPSNAGDGGGGNDSTPSNKVEEIFDWFESGTADYFGDPIVLNKKTRAALAALAGDATPEMVKEALRKIALRKQGWDGIKNRQAIILTEFPAILRTIPRPPTPAEIDAQQAEQEHRRAEDRQNEQECERNRNRRAFLYSRGLALEEVDAVMKDQAHHLWEDYDEREEYTAMPKPAEPPATGDRPQSERLVPVNAEDFLAQYAAA